MVRKSGSQRIVLAGISLFAAAIVAGPGPAQAGFFDQLFGGGAPNEPVYQSEPQRMDAPSAPAVLQRRRPVKRVAVEQKPVRQTPTDLMHDRTLQPGDAVMMKTGIHVYTGREGATHRSSEFTRLDDARRVPAATKAVLASLDGTRNDPLAKAAAPDTLASGRSAAVGSPIVAGMKFTDQRGVTIRYVGP